MDEIKSFFKTSWVGLAFAILLLIVGWKLTAPFANALLVMAWVILVATVWHAASRLSLISAALLVAIFGSVVAFAIYNTLWTEIENAPLTLLVTTSAADRPSGTKIGDISWLSSYGDLRIVIANDTNLDYRNVDLEIIPDLPVTAVAQVSAMQGVSIWRILDQTMISEMLDKSSGKRIDMMYSPIASTRGSRFRCDVLPSHSQIELVIAVVSLNDKPTDQVADKLLRDKFNDGHVLWLAHGEHTENVFSRRPVPQVVKITGHYVAQERGHGVSENVAAMDVMLEAFRSIPKPAPSP